MVPWFSLVPVPWSWRHLNQTCSVEALLSGGRTPSPSTLPANPKRTSPKPEAAPCSNPSTKVRPMFVLNCQIDVNLHSQLSFENAPLSCWGFSGRKIVWPAHQPTACHIFSESDLGISILQLQVDVRMRPQHWYSSWDPSGLRGKPHWGPSPGGAKGWQWQWTKVSLDICAKSDWGILANGIQRMSQPLDRQKLTGSSKARLSKFQAIYCQWFRNFKLQYVNYVNSGEWTQRL